MDPSFSKDILRILDANFNRSREGLRVCEEVARFVMEDDVLTGCLKKMRHGIGQKIQALPVSVSAFMSARDAKTDVGREPDYLERKRRDVFDLFLANSQRVKESLRVLEETSKIISPDLSVFFKKERFKFYELEQEALPRLEALRYHRSRCGQTRDACRSRKSGH